MKTTSLVPTNVTPMPFKDIVTLAESIYSELYSWQQWTEEYYSSNSDNGYVDCLLLNEGEGITERNARFAFKDLDLDEDVQDLIIDNFEEFEEYCLSNIEPTFSGGIWSVSGYLTGIRIDEVNEEISDEIRAKLATIKDQLIFLSDEQKSAINDELVCCAFDGIEDLDREYLNIDIDGSWNLILKHKHVDEFLRELADEEK